MQSQERIRKMNESHYGLTNDSILCKSGFIKTYSKPANPGRAKNFTNPPDYQLYFDHTNANTLANIVKNNQELSPPKTMNKTGQYGKDGGSLESKDSYRRGNNKLLGPSDLPTTRTTVK